MLILNIKLRQIFFFLCTFSFLANILIASNCPGYDELSNDCLECPITHYRNKGLLKKVRVKLEEDCSPKFPNLLKYSKEFFISNTSCSNPNNLNLCNGTKEYPFDTLIKAFIYIHNEELAEQFWEQEINFFFLSQVNYVKISDLPFYPVKFFSRFNATIRLAPYFCDNWDKERKNCFDSSDQIIDLILKTDQFSFDIYNEILFKNIRISGQDLVLPPNSTLPCFYSNQICCENYFYEECQIMNKDTNAKKFINKLGFINLKIFADENIEIDIFPSVKLKNFIIENVTAYPNENTWASLIQFYDSFFEILLENVFLSKNFFAYGYTNGVNMNEDLYYNSFNYDADYLLKKTKLYQNLVNISNLRIQEYNPFQFINLADGLFNIKTISSLYAKDIYISDFSSTKSLYCFYLVILDKNGVYLIPESEIYFDNVILTNVQEVGLLFNVFSKCEVKNVASNFINNERISIFSLENSYFNLTDGNFINYSVNSSFPAIFFQAKNSLISFNRTSFGFFIQSIAILEKSVVNFENCTFFTILIVEFSARVLWIQNSDFFLKKINIIDCFSNNIISYEFNNNEMDYAHSEISPLVELSDILFLRIELSNAIWLFSGYLPLYLYLYNFEVSESNKKILQESYLFEIYGCLEIAIIENIFLRDSINFFLIYCETSFFNNILLNNIAMKKNFNLIYYIMVIRNVDYYPSFLVIQNLILEDFTYDCWSLLAFIYFYSLDFSNCYFNNISFQNRGDMESIGLLAIWFIDYLTINSFNLTDNSLIEASPLFGIVGCKHLIFSNSVVKAFETEYDLKKSLQVLTMDDFFVVQFLNNVIIGMCTVEKNKQVYDEYGVISLIFSNLYQFRFENQVVTFENNIFAYNLGRQKGIIGIFDSNTLLFKNNTFFKNSCNLGALALINSNFITIEGYTLKDHISFSGGGAIFIRNCYKNILMINIFVDQIDSGSEGVLYFNNIMFLEMENLLIKNIQAISNGGGLFLYEVNVAQIRKLYVNNSIASKGAVLFAYNSYIFIVETYTENAIADLSGGFAYLIGEKTSLTISSCVFDKVGAKLDGATLSSTNIIYLNVIGCRFLSGVTHEGIINLQGFILTNKGDSNKGLCVFSNVVFVDNLAELGSNIFFSSNSQLIIDGLKSFKNYGSLFTIESDGFQTFLFENWNITSCEQFPSLEAKSNPTILISNTIVYFKKGILENNQGNSNLIKLNNAEMLMENVKVKNYVVVDSKDLDSSIFLIEKSVFFLTNCTFNYDQNILFQSSLFYAITSMFYSENDSFENFFLKNKDHFNSFDTSKVYIKNSSFLNVFSLSESLYLVDSDIFMRSCFIFEDLGIFTKINMSTTSFLYFLGAGTSFNFVLIEDTLIKSIHFTILVIKWAREVKIENAIFLSNTSVKNKRALYLSNNLETSIFSSLFEGYMFDKGSCITLENKNENLNNTLYISNCSFNKNSGLFGGAIYILGSVKTVILNSIFKENLAVYDYNQESGKGGCIVIDCEYFIFCSLAVDNSKFIQNKADIIGPTILSKFQNPESILINNSSFISNYDTFNFSSSAISTPVSAILISNISNNSEVIDSFQIVSGKSFTFFVKLIDLFNQTLLAESDFTGYLDCFQYIDKVPIEKSSSFTNNGFILFSDVKITFPPNSSLFCNLKLTFYENLLFKSPFPSRKKLDRSFPLSFKIKIRPCILGELLLSDNSCYECPRSSFSLDDPMLNKYASKCYSCPANAYCHGKNNISPLRGFWRYSSNSLQILKCKREEDCMGIFGKKEFLNTNNNFLFINFELLNNENVVNFGDYLNFEQMPLENQVKGFCNERNWGNLCFYCVKRMARFSDRTVCEECEGLYVIYIKMAFSLFLLTVYVLIQVRAFSDIERRDSEISILMRFLINHLQSLSLINLLNLGWTIEFDLYFSMQNYISFISDDIFIIDCLIQSINEDILLQKIIFTLLLPIILSLIMMLIWLIIFMYLYLLKLHSLSGSLFDFLLNKMRITILLFIFFLYPEIVRKCLTLLNCMEIDDNSKTKVLAQSPNIECWSDTHSFWVIAIAFPGILIWGLLAPLFILIILHKNKGKIYSYIDSQNHLRNKETFLDIFKSKNRIINIRKKISVYIEKELILKLGLDVALFTKTEFGYEIKKIRCVESVEYFKDKEEIQKKMPLFTLNQNKAPIIMEGICLQNEYFILKNLYSLKDYLPKVVKSNKKISLSNSNNENHLILVSKEYVEMETIFNSIINRRNFSNFKTKIDKKLEEKMEARKIMLVIKNLGFLYRGYRKKYYFWELLNFLRKFLLIFIGVFTENLPKQIKPTLLIMILVLYIYLHLNYQPYQLIYLNNLETISLVSIFLTGCVGILLFSDKMKDFAILFLIIVFIVNGVFFFYFLKYSISFEKIIKKVKSLMNRKDNKMKLIYPKEMKKI